jgi:hypothetical protein
LLGKVGVESAIHFRFECGRHRQADLLQRGPDFLEINVLAIPVLSKRFGAEVDVHRAGESKGDDERGRHQKIRADVLVHAGFEVAVTRQDAGGHEIIFGNCFLECGM